MSSLSRRRPQTQAERVAESAARLQEAMAELIAEQGYLRTSAAEIAERAGYSRSMVRDRYGSKDALLLALHAEYEQRLVGSGIPASGGLDAVLAGVDRLGTFAIEHPAWLRALFIVSFEAIGTVDVMRPKVVDWLSTLEAYFSAGLERGCRDGSVHPDIDPRRQAVRIVDEAVAGAYRWVLTPDAIDYPAYLRRWSDDLRSRYRRR